MKRSGYFFLTFFILAADQISKFLVEKNLKEGLPVRLTPKLLWLRFTRNSGAAFSLSVGSESLDRIIFSVISLLAVILVVYLLLKSRHPLERTGFALVLAGALGNLIDRIFKGEVTDFIDCDFPDIIMQRWPIFNLADSSLVIAMVLLAVYYIFLDRSNKQGKELNEEK